MADILIPIVFPDYKISVEIPKTEIDVLPYVDFDNFTLPAFKDKFSNLGHAGVLFIHGKSGLTKYFEYGRYDPPLNRGIVKKIRNLPDIEIVDKKPDYASLKKPLRKISRVSGQSGRIHGVYIEVENKFTIMLNYALARKKQNATPNREPYDLMTNSCIHFVKSIAEKAGVSTPWMLDPRPNSYIGEFRDDFPDLDYNYSNNSLHIEGIGSF